jgi:hypothetical protein
MEAAPNSMEPVVSIQQKRGWTMASLNGTGIHPLPPGAPATGSQVGTRGAPTAMLRRVPARAG